MAEELSPDLREIVVAVARRAAEEQVAELKLARVEFEDLKLAVNRLVEAQSRGEARLDRVEAAIEHLAAAQAQTDASLQRLSEAQAKTDAAVQRLVEAQAKTEARLDRVDAAIERLAEAQAKTDVTVQRLVEAQAKTDVTVQRLVEAQANTDAAVQRLSEAQAKTEARLDRVEDRLDRVEAAIERLAEAQVRTEEAMRELSRQVGALSENVGYGLEDIARTVLPAYLHRRFKLDVRRLERRQFRVNGTAVDVDLYGEGFREGQPIVLLGEAKSRIYRREVQSFLRNAERVSEQLPAPAVLLMFGYFIDLTAKEAAGDELLLVASYEPGNWDA